MHLSTILKILRKACANHIYFHIYFGGKSKGKIAFYCNALGVTRQGFYWYLKHRDDPWKYESIAEKIRGIAAEDECNDTYARCRVPGAEAESMNSDGGRCHDNARCEAM